MRDLEVFPAANHPANARRARARTPQIPAFIGTSGDKFGVSTLSGRSGDARSFAASMDQDPRPVAKVRTIRLSAALAPPIGSSLCGWRRQGRSHPDRALVRAGLPDVARHQLTSRYLPASCVRGEDE